MAQISERKPDITYYKKNYIEAKDDGKIEDKSTATNIKATLFSPDTNITPNTNVTLLVEIMNCGKTILNDIHVNLIISEQGISYVEGSALYYSDNSMPILVPRTGNDSLEFEIPAALSPGKNAWFSLLVTADELTVPTDSIYAYALVDSEINTNTIRFSSRFASISAEKTSVLSENGCYGKTIYTITLSNNGNIAACDIVLNDILATGFKVSDIYYNGDLLTAGTDYTVDSENRLALTVPSCIQPNAHGVVQIVGSF